ncbi:hypothetical protein AC1031_015157 [Aphanomyces cochlioides]|nr:hypothetical protein AC1031_015157 [Aphanomyces cochlioides]
MWKPGSSAPPVEKGDVATKDDKKKAKPLLSHKTLAMKVRLLWFLDSLCSLCNGKTKSPWPNKQNKTNGQTILPHMMEKMMGMLFLLEDFELVVGVAPCYVFEICPMLPWRRN